MFNAFLQSALDSGLDTKKVNINAPLVQIDYHKPYGKWYMTEFRNLTDTEVEVVNGNKGFLLLETMPELQKKHFTIIINGYNVDGFLKYMIPSKGEDE